MENLLTVAQVAVALGLKISTVRKMIRERRIDVVRPTAKAVRIPPAAVQSIIRAGYTPAVKSEDVCKSMISSVA